MDRRKAVKLIAAAPLAGAFTWTGTEAAQAGLQARAALKETARTGKPYAPQFFTEREWSVVRMLVDLIIPPDDRSVGAAEAGVPEFMDFIMTDQPNRQTPMRGGLAWLEREARTRFDDGFLEITDAQRTAILDDIAWPARARPEFSQGVAFFTSFRDLTAGGFWSSRVGIDDLQYMGNTYVSEWTGCPPEALAKLGVRYED